MTAPISVQLYSLRESMNKDFRGTVEKVARMGYAGVEPAGFPGSSPKEAMKLFEDLGLKVSGVHAGLPLGEKQAEILNIMESLGNPPLVIPSQPAELFDSMEGLKKLTVILNNANKVAKLHGFRLGFHNHVVEMNPIEGRSALLVLSDLLDPEIFFEVDTYWAKVGGVDPAELVKKLGSKAPLLHIKDGPCVKGEPMVALGEGVMDIGAIVEAGRPYTEWLIVELDACATDMVEAVEKSYRYLVGKGYAHGNKQD